MHDPLTGLPNRTLFLDRLGHALARPDRGDDSVAVLFLDLDNFKVVNDSLGHCAGDELLVATARRLRTYLRPGDTVARLGGDEFTVLLENVTGEGEVEGLVARIMDGLSAPLQAGGHEVFITASVGVVPDARGRGGAEEILRNADLAMYRAKENGKARHAVYKEAMHARATERLGLERDLRWALDSGSREESSRSTTSRRWTWPPARSPGSRRSSADGTPSAVSLTPPASSPSPRRPALHYLWAVSCSSSPAAA